MKHDEYLKIENKILEIIDKNDSNDYLDNNERRKLAKDIIKNVIEKEYKKYIEFIEYLTNKLIEHDTKIEYLNEKIKEIKKTCQKKKQ